MWFGARDGARAMAKSIQVSLPETLQLFRYDVTGERTGCVSYSVVRLFRFVLCTHSFTYLLVPVLPSVHRSPFLHFPYSTINSNHLF
jgi:hypothetical protein